MRQYLLGPVAIAAMAMIFASCGDGESGSTTDETDRPTDSGGMIQRPDDGSEDIQESGWTVLLDGESGLDNFTVSGGEANWAPRNGAIEANEGGDTPSFLVSNESFEDFALRVEFWSSDDANSGVFLRCSDPTAISESSCYEANIFDQRPDPTYGTGGIVNIASAPDPMPKAGGRWNTYEITLRGSRIVLILNGEMTVDIEDDRHASGPIALQWGSGTMRFRKVELRVL